MTVSRRTFLAGAGSAVAAAVTPALPALALAEPKLLPALNPFAGDGADLTRMILLLMEKDCWAASAVSGAASPPSAPRLGLPGLTMETVEEAGGNFGGHSAAAFPSQDQEAHHHA